MDFQLRAGSDKSWRAHRWNGRVPNTLSFVFTCEGGVAFVCATEIYISDVTTRATKYPLTGSAAEGGRNPFRCC